MEKRKKQNKKKLRTLILVLFLTITMFGTSTYAWFTANRNVTINSLDVHVEASNGLQISTDASSWKSVITNADITDNAYTGHTNMLPANVTAVSTDGAVGSSTGRLTMYKSIIDNDATTGDYTITTQVDTEAAGSTGNFIAFDVFLRVDENKTIYMTDQSNVIANGTDKGLKNAARVAFVMVGHGESTASASTLASVQYPAANMPARAIIWEPNATTHTALVTSSVAPEYGVTLNDQTTRTTYYGINATISTPLFLIPVVNPSRLSSFVDPANTTETARYSGISAAVTPDIVTPAGDTSYHQAFNLVAGVTKMRIYMWLEGQDIDCENGATGSDITFNLQFSTDSSAPTPSGG